MNKDIYLATMIITIILIRIIPVTIFRKKITNRFVRSFLFYVPYVTLAVMTFPAIMEATSTPVAGAAALVLGIIAAWFGLGLFPVSIICCVTVFVCEFFMI